MDPQSIFVLEISHPRIVFSCNLESKTMKQTTLTAMKHWKLRSLSNPIKDLFQYSWNEPLIVSYGSTINFCAGNFLLKIGLHAIWNAKIWNRELWLQLSIENSTVYSTLSKTCFNTSGMNLLFCLMNPQSIFVLEISLPKIVYYSI